LSGTERPGTPILSEAWSVSLSIPSQLHVSDDGEPEGRV